MTQGVDRRRLLSSTQACTDYIHLKPARARFLEAVLALADSIGIVTPIQDGRLQLTWVRYKIGSSSREPV
mgnify:CR=1 FL=1